MTLSRHSKYVILSWLILTVVAVILLLPGFAHAQIDINKLKIGIIKTPLDSSNAGRTIFRLVEIVLLIGGIIAFFYVIYGGFMYLTAGPDPSGAEKGRKTIFNALIGIIIISISYALVTFVASKTRELQDGNNANPITNTLNGQ